MITEFGSDIIQASAVLDKAAGQNSGDERLAGGRSDALQSKVRELQQKLAALTVQQSHR